VLASRSSTTGTEDSKSPGYARPCGGAETQSAAALMMALLLLMPSLHILLSDQRRRRRRHCRQPDGI